jgi:uncharacterized protein (TIGR02996 family)
MRTFEFSEGSSNKFWNIELSGRSFSVCFGRIGTAGQQQTKSFSDEAAAKIAFNKLIAEKVRKGYQETTPSAGSILDLAAQLPDEGDMLAAVAARPGDDTSKLVYADWLEEHGDSRSGFLRRFVAAAQQGKKLPSWSGLPTGWLEIIGYPLVSHLRSRGLADHRAVIMARARPAVAINTIPCAEGDLVPGATKFGGLPSLPKNTSWPRCERGPLEFLAQLDLAEMQRTVAGRALPATGLLSFFMYHNYPQDEFGGIEGRGVPGGLKLLHTPPGVDLQPLSPPADLTEDLGRPHQSCRLSLVDALDLPDSAPDWPEEESGLRPPLVSEASHQLFGYSHITVLAEDPTPGPEWQLLIRFDSDDKLRWGWGDGHRLFWYIRSAELRAFRLDETVAIDG